MRAHGGLLEVRDTVEVRHGRQEMRDMPADQPVCAGHEIYGQLYLHPASHRISPPRSKSVSLVM